jgi:hypothetical protein
MTKYGVGTNTTLTLRRVTDEITNLTHHLRYSKRSCLLNRLIAQQSPNIARDTTAAKRSLAVILLKKRFKIFKPRFKIVSYPQRVINYL